MTRRSTTRHNLRPLEWRVGLVAKVTMPVFSALAICSCYPFGAIRGGAAIAPLYLRPFIYWYPTLSQFLGLLFPKAIPAKPMPNKDSVVGSGIAKTETLPENKLV